jgi:hypothetical protein
MLNAMKRYVIERDIPGIGNMSREQLKSAAMTSCEAAAKLYGKIHWEHSYVAGDKTFCVYLADGLDPGACPAERLPGEPDHRSAYRHRSDNGVFMSRTGAKRASRKTGRARHGTSSRRRGTEVDVARAIARHSLRRCSVGTILVSTVFWPALTAAGTLASP